jgi:protein TonB
VAGVGLTLALTYLTAAQATTLRFEAVYPQEAIDRCIEGWVQLEFTVLSDGTVSNVRVINASPSGIFDDAAKNAIRRWRFEPKVENGQAVEEVRRHRIMFKLDECESVESSAT